MKTLFLLPLAYFAGVDGFALFAPYLLLVLGTAFIVKGLKRA